MIVFDLKLTIDTILVVVCMCVCRGGGGGGGTRWSVFKEIFGPGIVFLPSVSRNEN